MSTENPEDTPQGQQQPPAYDPERVLTDKSFGVNDEKHWATARREMNKDEIEFLRERSHAPGVAEGGGARNHYCMECHGVLELEYDSTEPDAGGPAEHCPHCGAEIDRSVRMMFNWVEIDQVPSGDLQALLPLLLGGLAIIVAGLSWWIWG
ncbi:MAG: hypothetical protein ACI9F9_002568 [Candidatus Paceibacteria bacterium]|jgi:hypothetical protein